MSSDPPFPFFPFRRFGQPQAFFWTRKKPSADQPPGRRTPSWSELYVQQPPHPRLEDRDNLSMGIRGQEGITFPPGELLPKHAGNCHLAIQAHTSGDNFSEKKRGTSVVKWDGVYLSVTPRGGRCDFGCVFYYKRLVTQTRGVDGFHPSSPSPQGGGVGTHESRVFPLFGTNFQIFSGC